MKLEMKMQNYNTITKYLMLLNYCLFNVAIQQLRVKLCTHCNNHFISCQPHRLINTLVGNELVYHIRKKKKVVIKRLGNSRKVGGENCYMFLMGKMKHGLKEVPLVSGPLLHSHQQTHHITEVAQRQTWELFHGFSFNSNFSPIIPLFCFYSAMCQLHSI